MGRKIFVSYKYADSNVRQFTNQNPWSWQQDTVRSYVDLLENYFNENTDHIYKGESDGEDISYLSDATIKDKLYDRIFDSTLTIVMLSPNMKESCKAQKYQWIPQEISYSLREQSRTNSKGQSVTSSTNALLGIVLPDRTGSYSYYWNQCTSCGSNCIMYNTSWLFDILQKNTFNIKVPDADLCGSRGTKIYHGDSSYITYVTWDDFVKDPEKHIAKAYEIQQHKADYEIAVAL